LGRKCITSQKKNYLKPYLFRPSTEEWNIHEGKGTSLDEFLRKIQKEIEKREEVRQKIQTTMRSATRLSKMAILKVHQGKLEEAKSTLKNVSNLFSNLNELAKDNAELVYSGIVDAAYQEYAEACILLQLVDEDRFVSFEEIGTPMFSFVLGLADVIGELRRKALDSLRERNVPRAEKYLNLMDQIYIDLTGMGDAYFLIRGLRRKCDIARRIIEATRGDVSTEVSRKSLESSIEKFRKELEERR
jgi:translin